MSERRKVTVSLVATLLMFVEVVSYISGASIAPGRPWVDWCAIFGLAAVALAAASWMVE